MTTARMIPMPGSVDYLLEAGAIAWPETLPFKLSPIMKNKMIDTYLFNARMVKGYRVDTTRTFWEFDDGKNIHKIKFTNDSLNNETPENIIKKVKDNIRHLANELSIKEEMATAIYHYANSYCGISAVDTPADIHINQGGVFKADERLLTSWFSPIGGLFAKAPQLRPKNNESEDKNIESPLRLSRSPVDSSIIQVKSDCKFPLFMGYKGDVYVEVNNLPVAQSNDFYQIKEDENQYEIIKDTSQPSALIREDVWLSLCESALNLIQSNEPITNQYLYFITPFLNDKEIRDQFLARLCREDVTPEMREQACHFYELCFNLSLSLNDELNKNLSPPNNNPLPPSKDKNQNIISDSRKEMKEMLFTGISYVIMRLQSQINPDSTDSDSERLRELIGPANNTSSNKCIPTLYDIKNSIENLDIKSPQFKTDIKNIKQSLKAAVKPYEKTFSTRIANVINKLLNVFGIDLKITPKPVKPRFFEATFTLFDAIDNKIKVNAKMERTTRKIKTR